MVIKNFKEISNSIFHVRASMKMPLRKFLSMFNGNVTEPSIKTKHLMQLGMKFSWHFHGMFSGGGWSTWGYPMAAEYAGFKTLGTVGIGVEP